MGVGMAIRAGSFTGIFSGGGGSGFVPDPNWNMTGNFANGNVVEFAYGPGGLNIPTDPRPYRWTELSSSIGRDVAHSRVGTSLTKQSDAAFQTTVKPPWATGCLRQNMIQVSNGALWFADEPAMDYQATRRNFVSLHKLFDWNVYLSNDKMYRNWPDVGGAADAGVGLPPDFYIHQRQVVGFNSTVETIGSAINDDFALIASDHNRSYSNNWAINTWASDEFHFKESSIDTYDGLWNLRRNGRFAYENAVKRWMCRTSENPGVMDRHYRAQYFDQMSNQAGDGVPNGQGSYVWGVYQNDNLFRCFSSPETSITTTLMNGSNDQNVHPIMQLPVQNTGSASGFQVLLQFTNIGDYIYMVEDNVPGTFHRIGQRVA